MVVWYADEQPHMTIVTDALSVEEWLGPTQSPALSVQSCQICKDTRFAGSESPPETSDERSEDPAEMAARARGPRQEDPSWDDLLNESRRRDRSTDPEDVADLSRERRQGGDEPPDWNEIVDSTREDVELWNQKIEQERKLAELKAELERQERERQYRIAEAERQRQAEFEAQRRAAQAAAEQEKDSGWGSALLSVLGGVAAGYISAETGQPIYYPLGDGSVGVMDMSGGTAGAYGGSQLGAQSQACDQLSRELQAHQSPSGNICAKGRDAESFYSRMAARAASVCPEAVAQLNELADWGRQAAQQSCAD